MGYHRSEGVDEYVDRVLLDEYVDRLLLDEYVDPGPCYLMNTLTRDLAT